MDSSYRTTVDWQAEPALAPWAQPPEPPPLPEPIEPPLDRETAMPRGFAEWFAISQTLLPALLFLPGSQAYRLPIRVGAYAISLVAFVLWWFDRGGRRGTTRHPAERWLAFVLVCVVLMIAHPLTNSLLSGIAQTLLYFSIFCPLFWAPAYVTTRRQLVRVLAVLLVCNGINSMVGVAQVYNPDRFMPPELSSAYTGNPDALAAETFKGPGGRRLIRPPGLFDTPGAVCGAGTIAALLGLIFCFEPIALWKRAIALAFSLAGISAIYLSHVRASLVTALAMMAAYLALLALQNERKRLATFAGFATAIVVVGLSVATVLGGESIQERFTSLFEESPTEVYYQARGRAARVRVQQPDRQLPARRRAGAVGDDARLLRQPGEPRFERGLGRGPAERLDSRRRRLPVRALQRRAHRHRVLRGESRPHAGAAGGPALVGGGRRRESGHARARLHLHPVRHQHRDAVLVPRRRAARRDGESSRAA